jgi:Protein of unknown function (DUF2829)
MHLPFTDARGVVTTPHTAAAPNVPSHGFSITIPPPPPPPPSKPLPPIGFTGHLNFGEALKLMREGKRAARAGWNGKGMFIAIAIGGTGWTTGSIGADVPLLPFIVMCTAQGEFVPWLASQTDMLAYDWIVL